ncbi:class I SAM-dependent methyltransferase [Cryptosporangium aurantiacum]|uniref:Methyltransferase domain-containing protein n=1 Tax=Cryptosporangium aurantiacum TaxID=134849 RepID=A0A1M7TU67_9ACTN|nr:methyltransferase domain-containing protein [Cryptosporangium aurantiacum]SHN74228.1 Methyltransferase domain-containing protein [Cryptosporangium aurantiacum]
MSTPSSDTYIYSQEWEQERGRLEGLSAGFDEVTIRHLTAAGVPTGGRCLEVGAGAGSIARWLATAVGPTGRVVATDLDVRFLEADSVIEVRQHDVTTDPLEEGAYDVVHARAVLEHIPDRARIVAKLATALRPGGALVLEDTVFGGPETAAWQAVTVPASVAPAQARTLAAVATAFRAIGADPEFGLQLSTTLRAAGLVDVEADLTYRVVRGGSPESAFSKLTMHQIGPRLIEIGLLSPEDYTEALAIVDDPDAQWLSIGLAGATGRAPGKR